MAIHIEKGDIVETYSTRGLSPRSKIAYWNDAICDVFTQLETDPYHPSEFDGELRVSALGRLSFAKVTSRPAQVQHAKHHVHRSTEQRFFLHLQARGALRVRQQNREALLRQGDFAICDSAAPYDLTYRDPCDTIVLGIPAEILSPYIPHPDRFSGIFMSGSEGIGNILSTMLRSLWDQMGDGIPAKLGPRMAENVMDLTATAYSAAHGMAPPDSAVKGVHKIQITQFIETHLRDPDLSPRMIAAAFRISPRYLHMLFSAEPESVSQYILRRRLEECAKQIGDQLWRQETITDIAFGWGFNSASHFARVFKEKYGVSPREFRNISHSRH